ncbi:helix-turn-helix domain-containing protein [Aquibacillus sp. 3ASR75-11]|uniref:Helix-turn-helix domain-containing protein n=1 Tax=Terrihalobacillus insolitus TaxID=2950438 RepID=A0A9X3WT57_9BACI|nr:DnaA N-terminal domain-containing protein [Terrihalobacillus insolitus]MDC3424378.1 helix-turn-helix domain-containing protein [Terrihalobacillus insolitus]
MESFEEGLQPSLATGEHTKYRYFRFVPTDVVSEVERKTRRKHGVKEETVKVKQHKKEYYSEESIANFQLESHTKLLPDMNGNKTIINNYLLRFWGPTFDPKCGGNVAYTYIILLSYCWDKDYTWISLDTIAKQITSSKQTVRKYLDILEKSGFIIRFWREQEDDERLQGTILIKVRQTLPFLSREQYNQLPKSLRKEHDRFLRRIKKESQFEFDLSHNYADVYEQLRAEVIDVKKPTGVLKEEIERMDEYQEEYENAKMKMSHKEEEQWNSILERIETKISKPSFDTWFKKTVAYKDKENHWLICLPNQFAYEWVENRYEPLIKEVMEELGILCEKLTFDIFAE